MSVYLTHTHTRTYTHTPTHMHAHARTHTQNLCLNRLSVPLMLTVLLHRASQNAYSFDIIEDSTYQKHIWMLSLLICKVQAFPTTTYIVLVVSFFDFSKCLSSCDHSTCIRTWPKFTTQVIVTFPIIQLFNSTDLCIIYVQSLRFLRTVLKLPWWCSRERKVCGVLYWKERYTSFTLF